MLHGRLPITGFRFADLAYVTDAKEIPDASLELLRDLDVLVLNALRARSHPTHLSIAEAVEIIETVRPRRAYLVHLSHETSHAEAARLLPAGIEVAWDGLTVLDRRRSDDQCEQPTQSSSLRYYPRTDTDSVRRECFGRNLRGRGMTRSRQPGVRSRT